METLDANGNPVSTVGEYEYDGDGKRVKKHVPSTGELTVFVYDAGGKLIGEYSTIAAPQAPKVSYTTADHLGSPRILTDENGATISRRDFMPYGEEIARQNYGSDTIRQKFTGYERDNEASLDFAQARMYSFQHGRFNAVDPIFESMDTALPQSMNRYLYVLNNPLFFVDPNGELWIIVKGQQNPQWVDKCPKNTTCFTALALENEKKGLNVYGSKNASDITEYNANKDGQIDVRKLSQHHDAQFIVADGQKVPEEYLSVNAAGSLFNIAELNHQKYSNDEKLVFTAGNASDGKPGNCNGKPCHGGHKGNDIDLRYMDSSGKPLQGDNAYKNADVGRTNWLIDAGKAFGFPYSYTGDETRFGRPDNTPKSRSPTEKVHRHHLHIGKTAPRRK
ncbi:MAG: RHS repeat-associated core domain-containing protein [Acidobacteria bacterium]|nr:RHS repeat-associated core domain-containing protein [Acidobacteriota bacterium]